MNPTRPENADATPALSSGVVDPMAGTAEGRVRTYTLHSMETEE